MTLDFKPRPDLPYQTRPEAERLRVERESGDTSFFRVAPCKGCLAAQAREKDPEKRAAFKVEEVIKQKTYHSKACYEKNAPSEEQAALAAKLGRPLIVREEEDEW